MALYFSPSNGCVDGRLTARSEDRAVDGGVAVEAFVVVLVLDLVATVSGGCRASRFLRRVPGAGVPPL